MRVAICDKLEDCFVCIPCFRGLEKISKVRKDLEIAFQGACDRAKLSLPLITGTVSNTAAADELVPPDPQVQPDDPPAKRARFNVPVISREDQETSPAVAVRFVGSSH